MKIKLKSKNSLNNKLIKKYTNIMTVLRIYKINITKHKQLNKKINFIIIFNN